MKKYYGYFIYNGNEYVIRFKIEGSLRWSDLRYCFMDSELYVRGAEDMICLAALDSNPMNEKQFTCAFLLSHDTFVRYRSRGIPRWNPQREIIHWCR